MATLSIIMMQKWSESASVLRTNQGPLRPEAGVSPAPLAAQPRAARSVALSVGDGRMMACTFPNRPCNNRQYRPACPAPSSVRRRSGPSLSVRALARGREMGGEFPILGLPGQFLRPVHGEIELGPRLSRPAGFGDGDLLLSSRRPVAASRVLARGWRGICRRGPVLRGNGQARNSPSESQRRWFSCDQLLDMLRCRPPAPVRTCRRRSSRGRWRASWPTYRVP